MSEAGFSRGIPDKPLGLSTDESRYWDQLTGQIALPILKRCDGRLLRELCSVLASQDRVAAMLQEDRLSIPLMEIRLALVDVFLLFGPIFGMSPRARASMDLTDQPDDFADWMDDE